MFMYFIVVGAAVIANILGIRRERDIPAAAPYVPIPTKSPPTRPELKIVSAPQIPVPQELRDRIKQWGGHVLHEEYDILESSLYGERHRQLRNSFYRLLEFMSHHTISEEGFQRVYEALLCVITAKNCKDGRASLPTLGDGVSAWQVECCKQLKDAIKEHATSVAAMIEGQTAFDLFLEASDPEAVFAIRRAAL